MGHMTSPFWMRWLLPLVLLTAFAVRTYDLEGVPPFLASEEADSGLSARSIMAGEVPNVFSLGRQMQPNPTFLPYAITMSIYGDTLWGLRMASVAAGMASVSLAYVTGRYLLGKKVGLGAMLFLALLPVHVHFSRQGVTMLQGVVLVQLAFLALLGTLRHGQPWSYGLLGLATAGGLYTYQSGRMALVLVPLGLAYLAIAPRPKKALGWASAGAWAAGLLLGVLPMLTTYAEQPTGFLANTEDVFVFTPRNLDALLSEAAGSPLGVVANQGVRMVRGLASGRDACHLYGGEGGLLGPLAFTLAIVGAGYAAVRAAQPRCGLLLIWLVLGLTLAGLLTTRQPYSCRLIVALPPLALLAVIGTLHLPRLLPNQLAWAPPVVLFAGLAYQLVFGYFINYRMTDYPAQRPHTELARAVARFEKEAEVVVAGLPNFSVNMTQASFFGARQRPRDLRTDEPFLPARPTALIVFSHQQQRLDRLKESPGLRLELRPFPSEQFTVWVLEPAPQAG